LTFGFVVRCSIQLSYGCLLAPSPSRPQDHPAGGEVRWVGGCLKAGDSTKLGAGGEGESRLTARVESVECGASVRERGALRLAVADSLAGVHAKSGDSP